MIRNYVVTAEAVTFHSGTLRLSEEQASARAFGLVPAKKAGEFRIVSPVQFKRGEEIGFDGEINKAMLSCLDTADATGDAGAGKGKKGKKGKKGAGEAEGEGDQGDEGDDPGDDETGSGGDE